YVGGRQGETIAKGAVLRRQREIPDACAYHRDCGKQQLSAQSRTVSMIRQYPPRFLCILWFVRWCRKFGGNHRWRNLRIVEAKPKPAVSATVEITPRRRIARKQRRTYSWVPNGTTASTPVYERRFTCSSS